MSIRLFTLVLGLLLGLVSLAQAQGIVSQITSAPVAPNGIVKDHRSAINVHLQSNKVQGRAFMNPSVVGYGIPANGSMEIELVSGFQRDPAIALDEKALILVAGAPQQGLPAHIFGLMVTEGDNQNTFRITAKNPKGISGELLRSPVKGARLDAIEQKGIKIIHIGRNSAFVSRGDKGVVEVRIKDADNKILYNGRSAVNFLSEPRSQIFLTNVTRDQRNHNWQRVKAGGIIGAAENTYPIPLMLYAKNKGLENVGIDHVGVLSPQQLAAMRLRIPEKLSRYNAGLIIQDTDNDGKLDPQKDLVLGGVSANVPAGATGYQLVSPLVNDKPFLSSSTENFHARAGKQIGGSVMQVVFVTGKAPGLYELTFTLLQKPGDIDSPDGSSATYSFLAE